MDENLTPAFHWLQGLGADICHYKVCSTFDSSPNDRQHRQGSRDRQSVVRADMCPVLVGAPQLKRYTAFGHLFAAYRGEFTASTATR
jgi:uncharacterized protein YgbK (DUF1537 family)